MASRIITKKGSGAPLASDLVHGELAVDTVNKRLYTENAGGTVIEVGTSPSTIDINAGTIDNTIIGDTTPAPATFTTFTSTGIDDNATSTAITIDASENVGIGTSSPTTKLNISSNVGTTGDFAGSVRVKNESFTAGTYAGVLFDTADTANSYVTSIRNASYAGTLAFGTNSGANATSLVERMRIDSAGNVGIGTSSPESPIDINRTSTDGNIATFRKDGTTVGSIGTAAGFPYFAAPANFSLMLATTSVLPRSNTGTFNEDGTVDLGASNARFKDLYLSGGVYLGGTGAANHLDDYETGTFTPTLVGAGTPTYGSRDGRYVKIGDMVFVTLKMTASTITQSSNTITIGGLPFAGGNVGDNDQRSSGIVEGDWQNMGSYVDVARFRLDTGSTLQGVKDNGSGSAIYLSYNDIGTSIEFNTSLSYKV